MDIAAKAESVIGKLDSYVDKTTKEKHPKLTTSKIRKFLTAVNDVTNRVNVYKIKYPEEKDFGKDENLKEAILFLKVKAVYQAGRQDGGLVKDFIKKSNLLDEINKAAIDIEHYERFAHYMEALIAYHRYNGGREN